MPGPRRASLVAAVVVGLCVVAIGVGGAVLAGSGGARVFPAWMATIGVVVVVGAVAEVRWRSRRPVVVATRTPDGERSTYVPFALGSVAVPVATLLASAAAGLVGVVVAVRADDDGGLAVAGVVAVGSLAWLAPWLRGGVRPGGVHLTPTRVLHRHQGTAWELRWEDVRGVVPGEPVAVVVASAGHVRRGRTAAYAWSGDVRAEDSSVVGIATRHLGLDGARLGHVMAVCAADPDLRAHLGDPAASDLAVFVRGT